jgi:hypothetical protein
MSDRGEALGCRHALGPGLDLGSLDLHGAATGAADEMMVMLMGATPPVEVLAVVVAHDVEFAGVGEELQVSIDGRQPDWFALFA